MQLKTTVEQNDRLRAVLTDLQLSVQDEQEVKKININNLVRACIQEVLTNYDAVKKLRLLELISLNGLSRGRPTKDG
jgi:hypothetical protein